MKIKNIELSAIKFTFGFDNIEIQPVCFCGPDKKEVEVCEEADADFWSLYVHRPNEGVTCIADCETRKLAEELETLIYSLLRYSRDKNGAMPVHLFESIVRVLGEDERPVSMNWQTTYHEVVSFITTEINKATGIGEVWKAREAHGQHGLYDLSSEWANEFMAIHKNTNWDGSDFWLTIDAWLEAKNKG